MNVSNPSCEPIHPSHDSHIQSDSLQLEPDMMTDPEAEGLQDELCYGVKNGTPEAPYTLRVREMLGSDEAWTEQTIFEKVRCEFKSIFPGRLKFVVAREIARWRSEPLPKRPSQLRCAKRCAKCGSKLCGRGRGFCPNRSCRAARKAIKLRKQKSDLKMLKRSGVIYKQVERCSLRREDFAASLNLAKKIEQHQQNAQLPAKALEERESCLNCGSAIRGRGSGYCVNAACREARRRTGSHRSCFACGVPVDGLAWRCAACQHDIKLLQDTGVVHKILGKDGAPCVQYISPMALAQRIDKLQQETEMAKANLRTSNAELTALRCFPRTYQIRRYWRGVSK